MRQRLIISEEEKNQIINLHRKFINESGSRIEEQGNPLSNSTLTTGNKISVNSTVPKITSTATPEEKKLIDGALSWVQTNQASIPKTVAEITKFLNDQVAAKKLTPESLPYIKGVIQSNSNGVLKFPPEEIGGTAAPTTTTTTTAAPSQPTVIQKGVKNPKVEALQNKLNEKFKSGLTPDGKWGPKTAAAVQTALASLQSTAQPNAGANDVKSGTATTTT